VAALAGKGQQVFMAAVSTFHPGKTVVQIAAVEIAIDHLLDVGPPESVLPRKTLLIDLNKDLEAVFNAAVIIRILRASGAIDCGRKGHDLSPIKRTSCRHNVERTFYLSREIFTGKIADYASKSCIYSIIHILLTSGRMLPP
jgi:hypothetical protein